MFNQVYFRNMRKYILEFPRKNTTVRVFVSPLQIRDVAAEYIEKQSLAFGDICIVKEETEDKVIAVVVEGGRKPIFFTEEQPVKLDQLLGEVEQ